MVYNILLNRCFFGQNPFNRFYGWSMFHVMWKYEQSNQRDFWKVEIVFVTTFKVTDK